MGRNFTIDVKNISLEDIPFFLLRLYERQDKYPSRENIRKIVVLTTIHRKMIAGDTIPVRLYAEFNQTAECENDT